MALAAAPASCCMAHVQCQVAMAMAMAQAAHAPQLRVAAGLGAPGARTGPWTACRPATPQDRTGRPKRACMDVSHTQSSSLPCRSPHYGICGAPMPPPHSKLLASCSASCRVDVRRAPGPVATPTPTPWGPCLPACSRPHALPPRQCVCNSVAATNATHTPLGGSAKAPTGAHTPWPGFRRAPRYTAPALGSTRAPRRKPRSGLGLRRTPRHMPCR